MCCDGLLNRHHHEAEEEKMAKPNICRYESYGKERASGRKSFNPSGCANTNSPATAERIIPATMKPKDGDIYSTPGASTRSTSLEESDCLLQLCLSQRV
jgi:hypothetical protein